MRNPSVFLCAALALLSSFTAGCRDREVTSYRIPKEKDPEMPAAMPPAAAMASSPAPAGPMAAASGGAMANTAVPTASGDGLVWTAPSHWVSKPASAMRKATYTVDGEGGTAELSITAFPGDVGGELANVNRWRSQLQLGALTPADLATAVVRSKENGLNVGVVDFSGTAGGAPQRLLGAIVPAGDATWFFKFTGPPALIAREQAAFSTFLKTVRAPGAKP